MREDHKDCMEMSLPKPALVLASCFLEFAFQRSLHKKCNNCAENPHLYEFPGHGRAKIRERRVHIRFALILVSAPFLIPETLENILTIAYTGFLACRIESNDEEETPPIVTIHTGYG